MSNHPMPDIEPLLKNLRLSGMIESLAQRNKEAIENKMSFTEFLAILLQDEIHRREMKKFAVRFKKSKINGSKTLEQFDFGFNPKINQQKIKDIATCRFISEKVPVLIVGPCGTGKSHLAQAIAHCAVRAEIDVLFFTQTQLFKHLQAARAIGEYDKKFQQLVKVPLLVIDDFGLKPFRTPQDEDLHDLIAERYEKASTMITSNLDFPEWGDAFPNKLLGAATIDRLGHGAYKIALEGYSYRTVKEAKNDKK
ncbi:ATP-binding protein [Legionella sp. MW5194]|uniref:IS21-like element helper ATPase IstB n=1 Tax=Legionella sp. MW5194 TaxID=2662448 RepID=UPI00193E4F69|nr:IS21-like element helper ATPase IstB [Legionella sp. MW5194]QRN03486.1 ATP-binding protein [Legionella sp. MW5194]